MSDYEYMSQYIANCVDMEISGLDWDFIEKALKEFGRNHGVKYSDLRRMYGDELVKRGLC